MGKALVFEGLLIAGVGGLVMLVFRSVVCLAMSCTGEVA